MSKIKKLIALMIILGIMIQNVASLAGVIDIEDESKITRGDLGFYTIQYWYEAKQDWRYVTYSRTYYEAKDGSKKIAYCVDPNLDGVGWLPGEVAEYNTTITEKLSNSNLWRVYKNGYPNKTPSQLGVETEDDAYLATKQAAYFLMQNRNLSEVYTYFRAGETEINGQNLTDIQRRGKKVIDAIYNLVNIGLNGSELISNNMIYEVSMPDKYPDERYVVRKFATENISSEKYTITQIDGAPNGSFITNKDGEKQNVFYQGEYFYLMMPKENIIDNYTITFTYEREALNYPVYYAKSKISNTQNYLVIADKIENSVGIVASYVNGNISKMDIHKIDEETREGIEGVKFNIRYDDGTDIGNYVTDVNGNIYVKDLRVGKIIVTEIETKEGYELDNIERKINVEFDSHYNIEITNKKKKGSLEIKKVDKDNNEIVLSGVEFSIVDEKENIVESVTTDDKGIAYIESINVGKYVVKEVKTNEQYRLCEDREIVINWNEKLGITVENERKKGNLIIEKVDKDNNDIKLGGVSIKVLNEENKTVGIGETGENGIIEFTGLPIGKYTIIETKTKEDYVLDNNEKYVVINDNETSKIKIENEKIKGIIEVKKISKDANNITHSQANTPIANVKFNIYDKDNKVIDTIVTNENGIAQTKRLIKGSYTIEEIEAGEWYLINKERKNVKIEENNQIVNIIIENESENPKVDINKIGVENAKVNQEVKYEFEIRNTGNVGLDNFKWYEFLPYENTKITKIATGTYNQEFTYSMYYKTSVRDDYLILNKELKSTENTYIDLSSIYLEENEKIIEIKVEFGKIEVGLAEKIKPEIYLKVNDELEDGTEFINETILEGYNKTYKVSDEDSIKTIIENKPVIAKKLPRTGF